MLRSTSAFLAIMACKDDEGDELQLDDTGQIVAEPGDVPDPNDAWLPDPQQYTYASSATFQMANVIGGWDGTTYEEDPTIVCTSGCEDLVVEGAVTMLPLDNEFGYHTQDFVGAWQKTRDNDYMEGWVGNIYDEDGEIIGLAASSVETDKFRVGFPLGSWCAGLGDELVKCSTEHYVAMEHVLTCHETVPYFFNDPYTGLPYEDDYLECVPLDDTLDRDVADLEPYEYTLDELAIGPDYAVSLKEDGKPLYRWGTYEKRPTDIRLRLELPLPDEWKEPDRRFEVTRAELAIVHTVTNSPNDQIRPEDEENEEATGIIPAYEVDDEGRWLSVNDCYEGDADVIAGGTVLKNPTWSDPEGISEDLYEGYTNAWYTSLDREPFAWGDGVSPRWRLQAPKFGQDLPSVEIPDEICHEPKLEKGEEKYEVGELTTTHIDLLDFGDDISPFVVSTGWTDAAGVSDEALLLTKDLDLGVYVKGESKLVYLFSANLYLDYVEIK